MTMTMQAGDREQASAIAKAMDWYDPHFRTETEYEVYSLLQKYPRERSEKTNEWFFVGHDECREAFQKPELFSNDWYVVENRRGQTSVIPENTDAPEQREYRRVLDPMFSPQNMAKLEEEIRSFATELLEKIVRNEKSEFVADFTMP